MPRSCSKVSNRRVVHDRKSVLSSTFGSSTSTVALRASTIVLTNKELDGKRPGTAEVLLHRFQFGFGVIYVASECLCGGSSRFIRLL